MKKPIKKAAGGRKPGSKVKSIAKGKRVGKVKKNAEHDLGRLRTAISGVDAALVKLLNERAQLAVEVGQVKRAAGLPVYAPHRESQVLDGILRSSSGPLPERSLEAIYRELMSGSFVLQQPMRIGYLGPPGTYSHMAAVRHFGSSVEFEDLRDIEGVFEEVARGHVQQGLVPFENSTGGGIIETLDAFRDGRARSGKGEVAICAEVQLTVHHTLLGNTEPRRIQRICSKPEVFIQCKRWISTHFPRAELVPMPSSSKAVEVVSQETREAQLAGRSPISAAIGSSLAGQLYGLGMLFECIEDRPDNITRFLVLSKTAAKPSGDDKTTVMFTTADTPGALVSVLQEFQRCRINLTHIEKRPSGRRNWTYTFFVDAVGHAEDAAMRKALSATRAHCREVVVLGSYPRSKRIL